MKKGTNKHLKSKWKHKLLIGIITGFICINGASASMGLENPVLKLNNELTITTTQFHTHPSGSITLDLNADTLIYADSGDYNGLDTLYFRYTMCVDSTGSAGWSNTSWVKNVKFEHTNISCKFYNGSQGHVMFVNYQGVPPVDVGSGNTNYWIVNFNNSVGAAFWNSVSLQLITIEVDTQGFNNSLIDQQMINQQQEIINQNQTQINQNQTIIDQNQTQISQNQAIWDQNNAIWSEQNKQNQKLDEFLNSDLSEEDKQKPNQDGFDSYQESENELKDKMEQADLNNISIGIDANSSSWIWDTLTRLIQSHSVVFGMFIAILSIGIIKLALGR